MFRYPAALVIAALASPIPASAQSFNGAEVIHAVGMVDLQQFVLQRGDTVVATGKIGDITVLAKTKAGFTYALTGMSCRHPGTVGCQDIAIQARYVVTPKVTDASLKAANAAFAPLKVAEEKAGKIIGMTRYVVLRDGVTRRNVLDNIDTLVGLAPVAARIAFGQPLPARARKPAANGGK